MTTEPASERGQIMLMKGHDLWIFLPSVSQPVRLPLAQRLTGAVANGDLARANFAGDYKPQLLRTEKVDGEPMYVLELTAVDRSVTYHRVLYWVRQSNYWPHKAEFYSLSDRLLKTCLYQKFERMAGRVRPTRLDDAGRTAQRRGIGARVRRHAAARPAGQGLHQGLPEAARVVPAWTNRSLGESSMRRAVGERAVPALTDLRRRDHARSRSFRCRKPTWP